MSYKRWWAITLGVWATFETSLVKLLWGNFSANRSLTTKEESPLAGKLNWIGKNRGPLYFLKDSLNNSLLQWVTNILPFCAFLLCSCPVDNPAIVLILGIQRRSITRAWIHLLPLKYSSPVVQSLFATIVLILSDAKIWFWEIRRPNMHKDLCD